MKEKAEKLPGKGCAYQILFSTTEFFCLQKIIALILQLQCYLQKHTSALDRLYPHWCVEGFFPPWGKKNLVLFLQNIPLGPQVAAYTIRIKSY